MTYFIAPLTGIIGAIVGYFVAGFTTAIIGEWVGVSNFEGGLGMLAFLGIGPLGGIVGLFLGIWLSLRWRGHASLRAVAWRMPLVLACIAALVAAGLWYAYEMRPQLATSSNVTPRFDFEIRLPKAVPQPGSTREFRVSVNTEKNTQDGLIFDRVRQEDDRPVISGKVDLYYRSSWRLLELQKTSSEDVHVFDLKLAARPSHMKGYGPWRRVDFVANRKSSEQPRKATDADAYEIRGRVVDRDAEFAEEEAAKKMP